mmetsp:Transcript_26340/g.65497  ORF Transcript_26340/g.65497 Transcript_26340/m.65497 type:complete len:330 (+) Transcript_26340:454-1443(+)
MARVVVLDEGHRTHRIQSHDAVESSARCDVAEVVLLDGRPQEVIHREVKHRNHPLCGVDVVLQHTLVAVPVLGHGERVAHRLDVVNLELGRVSEDEVEPQRGEAHLLGQPVEPLLDVSLHLGVGVIDVGRILDGLTSGRCALAGHLGVVGADGPRSPVRLLELGEVARRPLAHCATMVDHHIAHGRDAVLPKHAEERLELVGRPVLAVEVVPALWQITVGINRLSRRGKPHHGECGFGDEVHLVNDDLVPSVAVVRAVPVEALEDYVRLLLAQSHHLQHVNRLHHHRLAGNALCGQVGFGPLGGALAVFNLLAAASYTVLAPSRLRLAT